MKYLFVGDIHTHLYMFKDIDYLDRKYKFDKIIFLGDYVDDWNADGHLSLQTLNTVINLKKQSPDKYILLLGNHELSYLGYPCSGHCYELENAIRLYLEMNIDLFDYITFVECGDNEFACSHAGITNSYLDHIFPESENYKQDLINMNKDKIGNLCLLNLCSFIRGGKHDCSSFVWCDKREHDFFNQSETPELPYQIIGHTPVKTIMLNEGYKTLEEDKVNQEYEYYYTDSHSTYRDGSEFGDRSYLIWNKNKFNVVYGEENKNE